MCHPQAAIRPSLCLMTARAHWQFPLRRGRGRSGQTGAEKTASPDDPAVLHLSVEGAARAITPQ